MDNGGYKKRNSLKKGPLRKGAPLLYQCYGITFPSGSAIVDDEGTSTYEAWFTKEIHDDSTSQVKNQSIQM